MKFWKHTLLSALAFVGIATTVLYTACEKDSCTDLKCKNGGSCAEGFCRCQTGFEGAECEIQIAAKFIGTYYGYSHCNSDPSILDTLEVYIKWEPDILEFYRHYDPSKKISGRASGNTIINTPYDFGNGLTTTSVVLDNDKITVYENTTLNPGGAISECDFTGIRVKK